ncbi:MAG TPA: hypothetical protein PLC48_11400 [Ferruginibacter sp.]|nr:hypothetical protein [Ferruginibacter sp.]
MHVVYAPVYVYWLWLSMKTRSFFFFSASNPGIRNAGFLLESKKEIYDLIPRQYCPVTLYFPKNSNFQNVLDAIRQKKLSFPLIGKPDIGLQGLAVKKLEDEVALAHYVSQSTVDFLIQAFISYEQEAGIFYCRYPGVEKGFISGIVQKEFLTVTGDGKSTTEMLMQMDTRSILQVDALRRSGEIDLAEILPLGKQKILVPYGNHVRGAKFINASHLCDDNLTQCIHEACRQIKGFYFGRLDIRFHSWEQLKQGKQFSIIELNGAGSEPTHIYDPSHSVFWAWKEIIRHLDILAKISRANHRQQHIPYMTFSEGLCMFRENKRYMKILKASA